MVNGKRIDYLNRYIKTSNDRTRAGCDPDPRRAAPPGKNTIRLELTGMATDEKQLDDLGVLQMALEFRSAPDPRARTASTSLATREVDDT